MIFPPSDVKLIRDMQMDYNRARQGMREHRRAARPKTVVSAGMVDAEDLEKLSNHPDNAIIELNGLQPGQKVDDLLQAFRGPPIDPNLYETEQIFTDMMRVVGIQDANIGGGAGGGGQSATQSNIAEASRATAMGSNIDDIDDLLTGIARAGSQILLQECSVDTVKRIVGEGAVWPEMSKQQIADELWLQIEAGSHRTAESGARDRQCRAHLPAADADSGDQARMAGEGADQAPRRQARHHPGLPVDAAVDHGAQCHGQGRHAGRRTSWQPGMAPPGAPPGPPGGMPGAGPAQAGAGAMNAPQGAPPGAQRPPGQAPGAPPPNPMPGPTHVVQGGRMG